MRVLAIPAQGVRHLDDRNEPFPAHQEPAHLPVVARLPLGLFLACSRVFLRELGQLVEDARALFVHQAPELVGFEFPLGHAAAGSIRWSRPEDTD